MFLKLYYNIHLRTICISKIITKRYFSNTLKNKNDYLQSYKLQSKFLNFFQSQISYKNNTLELCKIENNENINYTHQLYTEINNKANELNNQELIMFLKKLCANSNLAKSNNIAQLLRLFDKECCKRFNKLTYDEILTFLDGFFYLQPDNLIKLNFFKNYLIILNSKITNLNKHNLIKSLYYLGLSKDRKLGESIYKQINCLNIVSNLLPEELCIFMDASFKVNFKLSEEILDKLIEEFIKKSPIYFHESAYLIAIIKVLRLNNKYKNYGFLKTLSNLLLKNNNLVKEYSFAAYAHILAFFAQNYYYDKSFLNLVKFSNRALKISPNHDIKAHVSKRARAKDICRLLWSMAHLGICKEEASEIFEDLLSNTHARFQLDEFETHELVGSLLSLVMLHDPINNKLETLIQEALTEDLINSLLALNKVRYDARLSLLLTILQQEKPSLINFPPKRITSRIKREFRNELNQRKELKNLWHLINNNKQKFSFSYVECTHSISNIFILGIMAYSSNSQIAIELLDDQVCVTGSERPTGLMKLKIRLLKSIQNQKIILIKRSELQTCAYKSDIINLIDSKLKQ